MTIKQFLKTNMIVFSLLIIVGCGTLIGNGFDPTTPYGDASNVPHESLDFNTPITEYTDSTLATCGSFTEESTVGALDTGRDCIHDAFDTCTEKKYLYNKKNSDDSRFVSFVAVKKINSTECQLHIHTVSNVPPAIGDVEKTCTTLGTSELPEVACGIVE